jgi:hypothetical protein
MILLWTRRSKPRAANIRDPQATLTATRRRSATTAQRGIMQIDSHEKRRNGMPQTGYRFTPKGQSACQLTEAIVTEIGRPIFS